MPSLADRVLPEPVVHTPKAMALLMRLGDGFVPVRARGVRATVEWRVEAPTGGDRLWMRIDDGGWLLTRDPLEPAVTVALSVADLEELVERRVPGIDLFLQQRLVVSGDVLLAVRLADFFGLPLR